MPRVLCVDDEPKVLRGLRRQIGRTYEVDTAESGHEALEIMGDQAPYPVVVSDMRMPRMSGAQFLAEVRMRHPDTVRILLTGHSDLNDAVSAVNEGNIFRFLTKPCPLEILTAALEDAIKQHRLVIAERELLEGTLRGSVSLLTDVLGLIDPVAFDRGGRMKRHVEQLCNAMDIRDSWDFEIAAMLSQIGLVAVPSDIVRKARTGQVLPPADQQLLDSHPGVARDLLTNIPRLERVAEMIDAEHGAAPDGANERIEFGAQLLGVAKKFEDLVEGDMTPGRAVEKIRRNQDGYSAEILDALVTLVSEEGGYVVRDIAAGDLIAGMTLAEDLVTLDGVLLLAQGADVTAASRSRILQHSSHVGIREPVRIRVAL